jgi:hypothetical protein
MLRRIKAEERMKRVILKGKKVMPHLMISMDNFDRNKGNLANGENDDGYFNYYDI